MTRSVTRYAALMAVAGLWFFGSGLVACSKEAGGGGNYNQNQNLGPCPEGTVLNITACLPVFDDCPAPDEIPVLGGGCVGVGVPRCAEGPGCATDFEDDGAGGCTAILPAVDCPDGEMALLGRTACEPIRDCGAAPWGDIVGDASTIYVDAGYTGGGSDGSQGAPFLTLGDAVAVAVAGDHVALAEGDYTESVSVDVPLTIEGRCPELVSLVGTLSGGNGLPPLTLTPSAVGTVLRGVRIYGPGPGLVLNETQDVALLEVEILAPAGYGVTMQRGASANLTRVKIVSAGSYGVTLFGGGLDVHESVIRHTLPAPSGSLGFAISGVCDYQGTGGCPDVTITRSLITDNQEIGVGVVGGSLSVADSVIRNTRANANSGLAGVGIQAQCDTSVPSCPMLTVTGSVVTNNRSAGIMSMAESTLVADTVVSNTQAHESNGQRGNGLVVQCDPSTEVCGDVTVSCSLVDGNHTAGVSLVGVPAVLSHSIIRSTQAQPSDSRGGQGLLVQCDLVSRECADASLVHLALVENTLTGIFQFGAAVEMQGGYVAHTAPEPGTEEEGVGFLAQCDNAIPSCPTAVIDGALFEGLYAEGFELFGGTYSLSRSSVYDVLAQVSDDKLGFGIYIDGSDDDASLDISWCEIRDPVVASAFYVTATGTILRSRLAGGEYSLILDTSPGVVLESGNELEGTTRDEPLIQ